MSLGASPPRFRTGARRRRKGGGGGLGHAPHEGNAARYVVSSGTTPRRIVFSVAQRGSAKNNR